MTGDAPQRHRDRPGECRAAARAHPRRAGQPRPSGRAPPRTRSGFRDGRPGDGELDLLGRDLLIHITGFFGDPQVHAALAETVIPGLVAGQALDQSLRVWVAGCSTGEEANSVVTLFRRAATAAERDIKLQVFASDIDAETVAMAREGWYPATITTGRVRWPPRPVLL